MYSNDGKLVAMFLALPNATIFLYVLFVLTLVASNFTHLGVDASLWRV